MLYSTTPGGRGVAPQRLRRSENLAAIDFLQQLNTGIYADHADVQVIAKNPRVPRRLATRPCRRRWFRLEVDMGWMHDTSCTSPRSHLCRHHHGELTFRSAYAFRRTSCSRSPTMKSCTARDRCSTRCPGRLAALRQFRLLYGYQYGQPGKKLLFMGDDIAQRREWNHEGVSIGISSIIRATAGCCAGCPISPALPGTSRSARVRYRTARLHLDATEEATPAAQFLRLSSNDSAVLVICNSPRIPRANVLSVYRRWLLAECSTATPRQYRRERNGQLGGSKRSHAVQGIPWTADGDRAPLAAYSLVPHGRRFSAGPSRSTEPYPRSVWRRPPPGLAPLLGTAGSSIWRRSEGLSRASYGLRAGPLSLSPDGEGPSPIRLTSSPTECTASEVIDRCHQWETPHTGLVPHWST